MSAVVSRARLRTFSAAIVGAIAFALLVDKVNQRHRVFWLFHEEEHYAALRRHLTSVKVKWLKF